MIIADGELRASDTLAQAAAVMDQTPAALQLRLLQTVVEVAAEKNSTLVLPFPVELLRFLERSTPAPDTQMNAASSQAGPVTGSLDAVSAASASAAVPPHSTILNSLRNQP